MSVRLWRSSAAVLAVLLLCAATARLAAAQEEAAPAPKYRVLIVRAAGRVPGAEKTTAPDAITHATDKTANTYIFSENLAAKLKALNIAAEIKDHSACKDFEKLLPVDAVLFAGPSYGSKLPPQLQQYIPKVKAAVATHPTVLYSCFTSCWKPPSGRVAVASFIKSLEEAGAKTAAGVALGSRTKEEAWDKQIKDFAASLAKALESVPVPK